MQVSGPAYDLVCPPPSPAPPPIRSLAVADTALLYCFALLLYCFAPLLLLYSYALEEGMQAHKGYTASTWKHPGLS